jgi:hypothetical protein
VTLSRLPGFVIGDKPGPLHCPFTSFLYHEKKQITYKVCTATLNLFNQVALGFAKSAPYPPCHRDSFPAKAPGRVNGWLRRVTLTYFIAGPLCLNLRPLRDRFVLTKRSKHNFSRRNLILILTTYSSTRDTLVVFAFNLDNYILT